MIPDIVKKVFIALGLAMVWLAFFCSYELKMQKEASVTPETVQSPRGLETYTLTNNSYSEEVVEELEFNNVNNKDRTLIYRLQDLPESESGPERVNTAAFADEFDALDAAYEEPEEAGFSVILAGGGVLFLIFGFYTFHVEHQKKERSENRYRV